MFVTFIFVPCRERNTEHLASILVGWNPNKLGGFTFASGPNVHQSTFLRTKNKADSVFLMGE